MQNSWNKLTDSHSFFFFADNTQVHLWSGEEISKQPCKTDLVRTKRQPKRKGRECLYHALGCECLHHWLQLNVFFQAMGQACVPAWLL